MAQQTQIEYPTDLRAPGAIDQLIAFHRQTFGGYFMEDEPDDKPDDAPDDKPDDKPDDSDDDADKDLGFPKNTRVADMTADQKAAYFEHKASKEEGRRKGLSKAVGGKTAEQIQADMAELEELRKGKRTDGENAVHEAEERVRKEEREKSGKRIAKATFEGALAHLEEKDRDEIIAGLSLASYVDKDGEVDTKKIRTYAAKIAPVDKTPQPPKKRDWGGGSRPSGGGKTTKPDSGSGDDAPPRKWGR